MLVALAPSVVAPAMLMLVSALFVPLPMVLLKVVKPEPLLVKPNCPITVEPNVSVPLTVLIVLSPLVSVTALLKFKAVLLVVMTVFCRVTGLVLLSVKVPRVIVPPSVVTPLPLFKVNVLVVPPATPKREMALLVVVNVVFAPRVSVLP